MKLLLRMLAITAIMFARPVSAQSDVQQAEPRPVFRVDVVEKVTTAVNYRHRSGATRIAFAGTPLMPRAEGLARVESKRGYIEIDAEFKNLNPALKFGAEYLTYVLWAITPEGRAANLGEVLADGGKGKLHATSELQVFGMVVTAEPYFAVRQPSDLVVLENEVRADTVGKFEVIDAKYELLRRGKYQSLANPLSLTVDPRVPIELYQARNAVQIAKASGAAEFAGETFLKAERSLRQAEAYLARKAGSKPVAMLAREAVQTAEDARELAVRRGEQARLAKEREEAERRAELARKMAEEEARKRAEAEAAQLAQQTAERAARERAEREAAERERLERQLEIAREEARKAEADAQRAIALLKERTASFAAERAEWEQARFREEQAELARSRRFLDLERAQKRMAVFSQLSRILPTRDTEQGLAVQVPPELFQTESAALSTEGIEKLALLAGVLIAHPGLRCVPSSPMPVVTNDQAGGGLPALRLATVRGYLAERGIPLGNPAEDARMIEQRPAFAAASDGQRAAGEMELLVFGQPIDE